MAIRPSAIASALVVVAMVACTSHHDKPCPPNEPAFRVQITATDGALPPDTELTVQYYGTPGVMESYSLAKGGPGNFDICCRPGTPTSGALPDVKCGIPPQTDASMLALRRDAATIGDAATSSSGSSIRDAAMSLDASSSGDAERDAASAVNDASPGEVRDRDAAGSKAAPGPAAIFCDLWTNGYALVLMNASGYAPLHVLLNDAYVPDPRCGVQTVEHRLTLTHADGGLLQ